MHKKHLAKRAITSFGIASAIGLSAVPSQAADPIGSFVPTVEQICSGLNEMPLRDRLAYIKHYPECANLRKPYEPFGDPSGSDPDPTPTVQPISEPTAGPTITPTNPPQPTRPTKPPLG